jgi:large subunit ribosomal protein L29
MSKSIKAQELRSKSVDQLQQELLELNRAHFGLRMQLATQQMNNTSQLGITKRNIARVKTLLREKGVQQ